MKQRVELSTWYKALSMIAPAALLVALCFSDSSFAVAMVCAALAALCCTALFYMPLTVSVDGDSLCIRRPLRTKRIPLADIATVELCPPTMAEYRLCGSGGWCGYWGCFREPLTGRYFAYYGKASDCFLVTLRSGRKYMLGCHDPRALVDRIRTANIEHR